MSVSFPLKSAEQLKQSQEPPKDSIYSQEDAGRSIFSHILFKIKQHPAIPVGLVTMLGVLGMMIYHRDNKLKLNQLARLRIGLQGFTAGAVFYAMYNDERDRHDSPYPWDWRSRGRGLLSWNSTTVPSPATDPNKHDS